MELELRGSLFFKEAFGEGNGDRTFAQLRHREYTGLGPREETLEKLRSENIINFFNLNIELVPPRGRYQGAEYDVVLNVLTDDPGGEIEVSPETTIINAVVSIGTFLNEDDMLRLNGASADVWVGDCVLPWGPPEVLYPDSEYYALLKVSYDHETSLDNIDTEEWSIEARREQTWRAIQEIYDIQGRDIGSISRYSEDAS